LANAPESEMKQRLGFKQEEVYFEKYREALLNELKRLAGFSCVYRRLFERRTDRLAEMDIAPAFFTLTAVALLSTITIWIDKWYDNSSERGFINFLKFIENHLELFDVDELQRRGKLSEDHLLLRNHEPITFKSIQSDRQKIGALKSLANFKIRRDKFEAHFDKAYFFNTAKLYREASVDWADLDQILHLNKEILNRYSAAFDGVTDAIEPKNASDVDHVLDGLHEYLQMTRIC
jgi:DNA-binding ferritin-like protein (Dps family)